MLDARCQDQHVAGSQWILVAQYLEHDLALENMYGDWPFRAMSGQIPAGRYGNDRKPERPFLDERARGPSVSGKERLIDHPFVLGQMVDQNVPFYGAVH